MSSSESSKPTKAQGLAYTTSDVLLGSVGRAIPASDRLDHAVRYFGTWGGSDKLMMTTQYTVKLLIFYLNWRAERQYRIGRRAKPASESVEGLFKFAGVLSMARRASGLWGFLGILKGLSALERTKPASLIQLNLQRVQGLSMLVFYPLEFASFFTAPFAPVLTSARILTPKQGAEAALWSIRAWFVYVAVQVVLLVRERSAIKAKEDEERANGYGYVLSDEKEAENKELKKKTAVRKVQIAYQLVANVSRLPVIIHWSLETGFYKQEILTTILSLISALAAFHGGWVNSRLPPPTSR